MHAAIRAGKIVEVPSKEGKRKAVTFTKLTTQTQT
jgi:hypothetical protein